MKTQQKLNKPPHHTAVTRAIVQRILEMTPEQARAFLDKRDPGIEETWMNEEMSEESMTQAKLSESGLPER